jgi:hypothetical protein
MKNVNHMKKISKIMSGCRLFSVKERKEIMEGLKDDYKAAMSIIWMIKDGGSPYEIISAVMFGEIR